jgi:hypothetical protein
MRSFRSDTGTARAGGAFRRAAGPGLAAGSALPPDAVHGSRAL